MDSSSDSQLSNAAVSKAPEKRGPAMRIHPVLAILVAVAWSGVGFWLCKVIEMALDIKISKLVSSLVNLPIGFLGVYYILPIVNDIPFGRVPLKDYLKRIGFYLPARWWQHALLGVALAVCTLSAMLVASLLTGRYVLDWSQINLSHIVFSLNPGIFEEIFYRGILVMLLLPLVKSVRKALILQIVIFGILHVSNLELLQVIDSFSVMIIAIAFTYAAYKTRTLLAGIVFHFLHDALLFFVQVPDGVFIGVRENVIFYGILWPMVGVACLVIWFAAEKLNVRAERELYTPDAV